MKNLVLLSAFAFALLGCDTPEKKDPSAKPVVLTTFYPTTYFAQRIAGDQFEVSCPVPADADPIYWKPTAEALTQYQNADLIIINGAGFEKWVDTVSLPPSKVVKTADPFKDEWIKYGKKFTHSHGEGGEHTHEGLDGHTWLDPNKAKIQSKEILTRMTQLKPDAKAELQKNFDALAKDLDEIDQALQGLTGKTGPLLASHPAYNYIRDHYKWNITNFDFDPEEVPEDKNLEEVKSAMEKNSAKIMLWEGAPTEEVGKKFEALGLENVEFSPAETLEADSSDDYLSIMKANIDRLKAALTP